MKLKTKKYLNAGYIANVIHLGAAAVPVNDGVIELAENDVSKWHGELLKVGFQEFSDGAINVEKHEVAANSNELKHGQE